MTGRMPEEGINPVEFPEAARHVWEWFAELNGSRPEGMSGPPTIGSAEMLAFFTLEGVMPDGWELAALRALDRVALENAT